MTVTIMYDNRKYDYFQVLNKVVKPFLAEVIGVYEDFENHYRYRDGATGITHQIDGFDVECKDPENPGIKEFAATHKFDLEKLTTDAYFLRSLRKRE